MDLSRPLFGFIFHFLEHCLLEIDNFTMVNDDRKQERGRKSMHSSNAGY